MFNTTVVFLANKESSAKIKINQGGTSSSKTYSIVQLLFYKAISEPKKIITVTGESIPNLKKGAYRDAENIFSSTPYLKNKVYSWNKTERIIYFTNGSIIEFISNLDEQSAKNGKRDYLFVNEANGITWPVFFQLAIRTKKDIYLDYNPSARFWCHDKLIHTTPESNELSATVELIISDHRHNVFLSDEDHIKIEGIKSRDLWLVYARGATGNLSGLIYPNWKQIPDEDFPNEDFFGGLDFGYTSDPTAAIKMCVIGKNLFLHELCYETALTGQRIRDVFNVNKFGRNNHIYCENDNEFISELRRLGLMAMPALKGPGSLKAGILKVNEYNVFYTASSKNIHNERTRYMWEKDKITGDSTNVPIGGLDHCFIGTTKITTNIGAINIRDIIEGDFVLTNNGYKKVLIKWDNGEKQVHKYCLQFWDETIYVDCTENHKVFSNGIFVEIKNLKPGDNVKLTDGEKKIRRLFDGGVYTELVYDLTIEDSHEYFANGILVHNCLDAIRYGVYTKYFRSAK